ncbi:guanosine diphosphatase, partial [Ascoidea rubescens DSM 1968]
NDEQYVIMIDAGSTGSRVHIYKFDTCSTPPKLLNEDFEMLKPGLSSFDTDAEGAKHSLDPLLNLALKKIPENKHSCTPIALKATAGLRLLGLEKSNKILQAIEEYLIKDWPFALIDENGVIIMEGKDEGVYAWITTNYLLGNIGNSDAKLNEKTAAVFDLGGGSTQIVFEPQFDSKTGEKLITTGEYKYQMSFGNQDFELYQFSHLGYGLMEGRNKINSKILEAYLKDETNGQKILPVTSKDEKATATLVSPCVPPGVIAEDVSVNIDDTLYKVNFKGPETPSGAQCRALSEKILNKDLKCDSEPCSFNGVYQPSLMKNFKKDSDMFIFSYFYDRTNPIGMPSSFTLGELFELTRVVCNGDKHWTNVLGAMDGALQELHNEPQWCLDLSFMVSLLYTGYDIPLERELKTAKTINHNELGWCLGASLPLLDKSNWKCRAVN